MQYFSIALYLIFLSYKYDYKEKKKNKKIHQLIILIILILLSGLRYRMAPDSVAYMSNFEKEVVPLSRLSFEYIMNSRYQPLWIIINSLCKSLDSYILLQIITSIILNISIFYFFQKTTNKIFTCILFYYLIDYFYFSMEIIRESLAISMFLLAIIKYNNRQYINYYFYILLSFMFHLYAFVLFFVPLFLSVRISNKVKWLISIILIIFLSNLENATSIINSLTYTYINLDLSTFLLDYGKASKMGYLYMLLRITPAIIIMLMYKEREIPHTFLKKHLLFSLSSLYIICVLIRATSIPFMDRFSNYFIIFTILLGTNALYDCISRFIVKPLRFHCIFLATILIFTFNILPLLRINPIWGVPLYKRYYPYSSFLSKKTDPDREYLIRIEAKE